MKLYTFFISLVFCQACFGFEVDVVTRKNLIFSAPDISATKRSFETFEVAETSPEFERVVKKTALDVIALLPEQYRIGKVTINFESEGIYINSVGENEIVPMSALLSVEMPEVQQIRICNYEYKTDINMTKMVVAHEMGHLITSIAWKASGKIPPDEINEWRWTKAIYEGVADYFAATVNDTSDSFGTNAWYARNILKYRTLQEAQQRTWIATIDEIRNEFENKGLLKYQAYKKMFSMIEEDLNRAPTVPIDTNAVGSWVAGQLWLLNEKYGKDKVVSAVLNVALTGEKRSDPQSFVDDIRRLVLLPDEFYTFL